MIAVGETSNEDESMSGLIAAMSRVEGRGEAAGHWSSKVAEALNRGLTLTQLAIQEKCQPAEILAGLFLASPLMNLRQGKTKPGRIADAFSPSQIGTCLETTKPERFALSAGLLQWVGAWEASHQAAQEIETGPAAKLGAWWHAIAHRREPDAFNANYWVQRAGPWPELAKQVLLGDSPDPESAEFFRQERWQPTVFFNAVANCSPGSPLEKRLERLQFREMLGLLEATWHAVVS